MTTDTIKLAYSALKNADTVALSEAFDLSLFNFFSPQQSILKVTRLNVHCRSLQLRDWKILPRRFPKLKVISIGNLAFKALIGEKPSSLSSLENFSHLETVIFRNFDTEDVEKIEVPRLTSINFILVTQSQQRPSYESVPDRQHASIILCKPHKISTLTLTGQTIHSSFFSVIAQMNSQLTQLNLGRSKLDSEVGTAIGLFQNLTHLCLEGSNVTDDTVEQFAPSLTNLRCLNLAHTRVTQQGPSIACSHLEKLEELVLHNQQIEFLQEKQLLERNKKLTITFIDKNDHKTFAMTFGSI